MNPAAAGGAALPDGIPPALLQLMQQDGVRADEIQYAVAAKGYFPNDMPISAYPADFVQGVLIGAWPQVRGMVMQNREAARSAARAEDAAKRNRKPEAHGDPEGWTRADSGDCPF